MSRVSVALLSEALDYDPTSGVVAWKTRPMHHFCSRKSWASWNAVFAGKAVGRISVAGYLVFQITTQQKVSTLKVHRVAWALHYGDWPKQQIDHVNGVRTDNRLVNLRDVSNFENARNHRRSSTNTSGYTGVTFHKRSGKWMAQINHKGQHHYLGVFQDIEEASAVRKAAADAFGFHPNHGGDHVPA